MRAAMIRCHLPNSHHGVNPSCKSYDAYQADHLDTMLHTDQEFIDMRLA
jgi:hypothetical protein